MNKKKKIAIALVSIILICLLVYIVKPIYYRIYPFNRFTVEYNISCEGNRVECSERYYMTDSDRKANIKGKDNGKLKIKGGVYGIYDFVFVVDNETMYNITEDKFFLDTEDLKFKINYFNTNSWHITKISVDIEITNINGEWYAVYQKSVTEPQSDMTSKTVTEKHESKVPLKDLISKSD